MKIARYIVLAAVLAAGIVFGPGAASEIKAVANRHEPVVISTDTGGVIIDYMTRYEDLRRDRRRAVIIDGICISACTLITGMIESDRVCVTPFAKLAFHSAHNGYTGAFSKEGTRLLWNIYPENVRAILRKRGWDGDPDLSKPLKKGEKPATGEHPDLIYIDGEELRSIYKPC